MASKTTDRVMTLHPEGKQGVNIESVKYAEMRRALLRVIPTKEPGVPFSELVDRLEGVLDDGVYGPDVSRPWFVTTVKLDLEARGLIARVAGRGPQRLRRVGGRS